MNASPTPVASTPRPAYSRSSSGELKVNDGRDEEGVVAECRASDRVRRDRAEHDEPERSGLEVTQDQLQREEHSGDRSVERRRDPAGGAAGDEQPQLGLRQAEELAGHRAEGGTDLDDRPLAADRAPGADAQSRRERLDDGYLRAHAPALAVDGVHHLRDAMAAGLGREARHQRTVDQPADHRHREHEPDPDAGDSGLLA